MKILDTLKPTQQKLLNMRSLKKGTVLFHENDKCESIGIVINGQISIVSYLIDGKEIVYNQITNNGIFGNNLLFSSEPYYKGNIIVDIDSEIAFINKKDLVKLLSDNDLFLTEYLKIQSDFGKTLNNKIKLLSIDSAEERFYFYMHEHSNAIKYSSISDLAKKLYLKRETLSRLISKLVKQKKIKKDKESITLL